MERSRFFGTGFQKRSPSEETFSVALGLVLVFAMEGRVGYQTRQTLLQSRSQDEWPSSR